MGNLCCAREHSVQFFVQFFTQLSCTVLLRVYGSLNALLFEPALGDNFCICLSELGFWLLHVESVQKSELLTA